MAVDFGSVGEETVKVILSCDKAIGADGDYDAYIGSLDETLLKLEGEPTRFLMKKRLKYKVSEKLKKQQMDYSDTGGAKVNGAFYMEDVRMRWCGIENSTQEFKKDGDGGASFEMMEKLEALGGVLELYAGCMVSIKSSRDDLKKK